MNKQTILDKISSLFDIVEDSNVHDIIEINLMSIIDKDGKEYQVDALEVGAAIYIKEGEEFIPLVDGELEVSYEDKNWVIKSDETGKIASIEEKMEEEGENQPTEEIVEEVTEEMETEIETEVKVELSLEGLAARIEILEAKLLEKETEMAVIETENIELKDKFSKLPAAEPIINQIKKFEFKEEKTNDLTLDEWVKTLKK